MVVMRDGIYETVFKHCEQVRDGQTVHGGRRSVFYSSRILKAITCW